MSSMTAGQSRKTVTVLFCDLTGSTALGEQLDPESLREVIERYFAEMRAVIERHGGTIEKFIGDAVMAVFGVPRAHEDDALRAVRAAADMQTALATANERFEKDFDVRIQARIGVNTGEVLAADGQSEGTFVSGDAVNVAARLEQAAEPGAVLLGESTYQLVRSAVIAEALEPITVKGKSEPLSVYRLVLVDPGAEMLPRRLDAPLVGRWDELELLRKMLGEVRSSSSARLVTVVGEAGIGKSRLAHELVSIACDGARVLRGRCLPYGEGITFWPVAEVLEDAAGIEPGDTADATRSKIASLLPQEHQGLVDRLSALVGAGHAAGSIQETFLAVRRVLDALAVREPVVVIFDDIQWGEETFLDLIRYLASFLGSSPVFIVCLARPELLDAHADWGQSSELIRLTPLDGQGSEILVGNLLGKGAAPVDIATTIVQAAGGNPLFIEEMLRMLVDQGLLAVQGDEWVVTGDIGDFGRPETVHAVILARLDSLDAGEKQILQTASVVGEVFWWSAVAELTDDATPTDVARRLQALVRKDLIRPDPSMFFSEDAFRFGHLLIRDVAYEGLPKKSRANLHERFATWVAARAERSAEFDEIIGFHLEQAHRYLTEVAPRDERLGPLAVAGAQRLRTAGLRGLDRGDTPAAVTLLARAIALTPSDDPGRLLLMLEYGEALQYAGRWREAEEAFTRAMEDAQRTGAQTIEYRALVRLNWLSMHVATDLDNATALAQTEPALAYFEETGDDVGLGMVLDFIGDVVFWQGECTSAIDYYRRAIEHAERAGARRAAGESRHSICLVLAQGLTPAKDVIAELESMHREHEGDRVLLFKTHRFLAMMHAVGGDFDRARLYADDAVARARELGMQVDLAGGSLREAATVARLEGDLQRAEACLREGVEILQRIGDKGHLDSVASDLALLLLLTPGREQEALEAASLADAAFDTDADAQVRYRAAKAVALVRLGQSEEAEFLARDSVRRAWATEYVFLRAVSQEALSEVLHRIGRTSEAAEAMEQAIATHEAKGNIVEAERDRRALAELRAAVERR